MSDVSEKPRTSDHHKRPRPENWEPVGVATITQSGPAIACSCGWDAQHKRTKIREDKAERHIERRHGGQAMWL